MIRVLRVAALLLPLALLPATARADEDELDPLEHGPIKFLNEVRTTGGSTVDTGEGSGAQKALAAYEKHTGNITPAAMAEIYKAAGTGSKAFKNVAFLIGEGKISDADSIAMGNIREAHIEGLIMEIGKEKGWRIARSDSGNMSSGMKSDLDQTFYVFEGEHKDGVWDFQRKPEHDGAFIAEFNKRWQERFGSIGLTLEAVDLASIEGRNRFPDVRVEDVNAFHAENRRTHEALRNTPGAYTYGGAVGAQMQFRALQAILQGNVRAFQVYEPVDGTKQASDWQRAAGDAAEAIRIMFGKRPELRPVWGFDAALANFLELQHYMSAEKFETKYHLRTLEDSIYSKWLVEMGYGRTAKIELVDVPESRRKRVYEFLLKRVFPGTDEAAAKRRKFNAMALEISVAQRLLHKGKPEHLKRIVAFKGNPPSDPGRRRELIFDELGREIHGAQWDNPKLRPKLVDLVDQQYRRISSDFCVESAYHTSKEAFAMMLDEKAGKRIDLDRYRQLLGVWDDAEWAKTKQNLGQAAHLTFLYGIYDLGIEKSTVLMERLRQDFGNKYVPHLLWLWTRGRVQGVAGPMQEMGVRGLYEHLVSHKLPEVGKRLQSHALAELGFSRVEAIEGVNAELQKHRLEWDAKRFARNMAIDPGNLDAIAQIARVYIESEGDPEAVQRAIAKEILMAVPVLGQVVGATQGGLIGLGIMGAALYYPPVGVVAIVVSVGQAGYAIYTVENVVPMRANAVNAVYRGWIGPALRDYDKAPPQFTVMHDDPTKRDGTSDEERLASLRGRLREASAAANATPPFMTDVATVRQHFERQKAAQQRYAQFVKELTPEIQALEEKKRVWRAHARKDRSLGGFFTGAGARTVQVPFRNHLLHDIPPIVAFSPRGIVDFRAQEDRAAVDRLEREVEQASDAKTFVTKLAAYREAALQLERQERAERYLACAKTEDCRLGVPQAKGILGTREAQMGRAELRHKIRRDSLYPALQERGITDPDQFVDAFFESNQTLLDELLTHRLVPADSDPVFEGTNWGVRQTFTTLRQFPADHLAELKQAVRADYERSKLIWERFQEREQVRELRAKQSLDRQLQAFEAAGAGEAVYRLRTDKRLQQLYAAMREGVSFPSVPELQATVYRELVPDEAGDGDPPANWAVSTRLRADPHVFRAPYETKLLALTGADAEQAARSRSHKGVPLFPSTVATIERALSELGEARGEKDDRQVFLVSVTCEEVDASLIEGVPTVRGRSVIAQHVSWMRRPAEKSPLLWFLPHQAEHHEDATRYARALATRMPALQEEPFQPLRIAPGRTRESGRFGRASSLPVNLALHPQYLDVSSLRKRWSSHSRDPSKIAEVIRQALARRLDHIEGLDKTWHLRVECGDQVRWGFGIGQEPHRIHGIIGECNAWGLKAGWHDVQAKARLSDGTLIEDRYRIQVEPEAHWRTSAEKKLDGLQHWRSKHAADPRLIIATRRLDALLEFLADVIKSDLIESGAAPALLEEAKALADEVIPAARAKATGGAIKGFLHYNRRRLSQTQSICRVIGTSEAYDFLESVLGHVEEPLLAAGGRAPEDAAEAHLALADIVVAHSADLDAARRHVERARKILDDSGAGSGLPPLDEWWPKEGFDALR